MTDKLTKQKNYRPEVDGLRAIAVIGVILSHAQFNFLPGGFLGVDVFFVISGFLITQVVIGETTKNTFSVWDFYSRRVRRLAPALYFVVLATVVAAWFISLPDEFIDILKASISVVLFSSNMFFWAAEADYFATSSLYNPLLHMWSLSVEEQFYFFFSIWVVLFRDLLNRKVILGLIIVFLMSLFTAEWGARNFPTASYYFIFTRAWELTLGCIGAIYFTKRSSPRYWISSTLSFAGVATIILSFILIGEHNNIPGLIVLAPCVGTLLVLLYGQNSASVRLLLGNKPIAFIGLISYSLYLWHQPVFAYARILTTENLTAQHYVLLILLIILLASLTWAFIEQPFRSKKSTGNKRTLGYFALFSSCIIVCCAALIGVGGNQARLSEKTNSIVETLNTERRYRSKTTLYDKCHFRPDTTKIGLDKFVEQWKCTGRGEMADVIVVGDSHAADIAYSLRENGVTVGQLTGAGCSLEPIFMAPHCETIFTHLKENYLDKGLIQGLILSNRYNEYEMSTSAVNNTNEFWDPRLQKIIFSSKPEYPRFHNQLIRNKINGTERYYADFTRADRSLSVYSAYESKNQLVLNTKDLFCGMTNDKLCKPVFKDSILISDGSHFSSEGATLFGAKIGKIVLDYFDN